MSGRASWPVRCRAASSACSRWPRVLVLEPRLLIADELSLGLAPIITDEVYAVLMRIKRVRHVAAW